MLGGIVQSLHLMNVGQLSSLDLLGLHLLQLLLLLLLLSIVALKCHFYSLARQDNPLLRLLILTDKAVVVGEKVGLVWFHSNFFGLGLLRHLLMNADSTCFNRLKLDFLVFVHLYF